MKRKVFNFLLVGTLIFSINTAPILGATYFTDAVETDNIYVAYDSSDSIPQEDLTGFSPIDEAKRQERIGDNNDITTIVSSDATRISQSRDLTLPDGRGTLTSNVWRNTFYSQSGNTLQWDYQVSAFYNGGFQVESIRTSWQGSASLRNSANISLGVSSGGIGSAGVGSSWQNVNTTTAFIENSQGQNNASHRSNMFVAPARDYRANTISLANTARVQLRGSAIPYSITASV